MSEALSLNLLLLILLIRIHSFLLSIFLLPEVILIPLLLLRPHATTTTLLPLRTTNPLLLVTHFKSAIAQGFSLGLAGFYKNTGCKLTAEPSPTSGEGSGFSPPNQTNQLLSSTE